MTTSSEVHEAIRKHAIKNALEYGKANDGSVLNKVISEYPELKSDIKSLAVEVKKVVADINSYDKSRLEAEYAKHADEFEEIQKIKLEKTSKANVSLEGVVPGKFKTRFPPEPNGYMHIGHSKPAFMESEFARMYNGQNVLYFDDTNPDAEKQEFVDAFKHDLDWLGIKFDSEYYASDNVHNMYKHAQTMISDGNAYVCTCTQEQTKSNRESGTGCEHKVQSAKINAELWNKMVSGGFKENEATLRLSYDMKATNTVMRDPVLFRIKTGEHYRQKKKYCAWPTYDFNTTIMDSQNGITDVIRSKEYELRDELADVILDKLGLRKPRIHSIARLEINNNLTSKRKLNALIKEGKIGSYDDPRLVTITALRRRGIMPQAIKELALRFGMSKTESSVDIDLLLSFNRKIIDPIAYREFLIIDPVQVTVENLPVKEVKMKSHPSKDLGERTYQIGNRFIIERSETERLKSGSVIRLKDAFCIKIKDVGKEISMQYRLF